VSGSEQARSGGRAGKGMMIYEIINMSDHYTLEADDFLVAAAATMLVGRGNYGLSGNGEEMPIFLIGGAEEWVFERYGGMDEFTQFIRANTDAIASCLDTVAICHKEDRPIDMAEYRARLHDENRTSLNDIGRTAWEMAEALREKNTENA